MALKDGDFAIEERVLEPNGHTTFMHLHRDFDILLGVTHRDDLVVEVGNFSNRFVPANSQYLESMIVLTGLSFTGVKIRRTDMTRPFEHPIKLLCCYTSRKYRMQSRELLLFEVTHCSGSDDRLQFSDFVLQSSGLVSPNRSLSGPFMGRLDRLYDPKYVPTLDKIVADDTVDHIKWMDVKTASGSWSPALCKKARAFAPSIRNSSAIRRKVSRFGHLVRKWLAAD
jgi:hypothetical protein